MNNRVEEIPDKVIERWSHEQAGAEIERTAVVEYLRREANKLDANGANFLHHFADAIERREHET